MNENRETVSGGKVMDESAAEDKKVRRMYKLGIFLAVLMLAFAGWLVKSGIDQKNENARLREICTVEVAGVVAGYRETGEYRVTEYSDDTEVHDSRRAFPTFEYTVDGKTYSRESGRYDSYGKRRYETGKHLAVFHAPDDPETIYIREEDTAENAWICIIFGAALFAFLVFALVKLILMLAEGP